MKNRKKRKKWLAVVLCYLAALVVWCGACGVRLARDTLRLNRGEMPRTVLSPGDFELDGVTVAENFQEEGYVISANPDPQMRLDFPGGREVSRFVFKGRAVNKAPGEMVLYYTTKPGQGFSEQNKLWARQSEDGAWYFDLHGRTVWGLRFDPDSVGGVYWQVDEMVLNERKPVWAYFAPDTLQAVMLLVMPLVGWAVVTEIFAYFQPLLTRRRFEKRWQRGEEKPPKPAKG